MIQEVYVTIIDGERVDAVVQEAPPVQFAFIGEQGPEGVQGPPGGDGGSVIAIDRAAQAPLYSGAVTAEGVRSITDSSASWQEDEFVDSVVKILHADGTYCVGVVESNSENTLYFDDDLLDTLALGDTYQILDTVVVEASTIPTMVSVDTRSNNAACAVLLPASTPEFERSYVHAYIERSNNGDQICPIVCRGQDRQAGAKYGELIHQSEGVRLYQHQLDVPHWDIIQVYNVNRLATGYWSSNEPVASAVFAPIGSPVAMQYDYKKRFISRIDAGVEWLVYTSLLERNFLLSFSCSVEKTGGTGELFITFATKDGETDVVTMHTERVSSTRFASGVGRETLFIEIPVTLKRGDSFVPAARNSGGTFSLSAGSYVRATEL